MCLRVCLRKLSPNAEIIAQDIDQSKRHVLELKSSLLGKQASQVSSDPVCCRGCSCNEKGGEWVADYALSIFVL